MKDTYDKEIFTLEREQEKSVMDYSILNNLLDLCNVESDAKSKAYLELEFRLTEMSNAESKALAAQAKSSTDLATLKFLSECKYDELSDTLAGVKEKFAAASVYIYSYL